MPKPINEFRSTQSSCRLQRNLQSRLQLRSLQYWESIDNYRVPEEAVPTLSVPIHPRVTSLKVKIDLERHFRAWLLGASARLMRSFCNENPPQARSAIYDA